MMTFPRHLPLHGLCLILALTMISCVGRYPDSNQLLNEEFKPTFQKVTVSMFVNVSEGTNLDYQLAYVSSIMESMGEARKLYVRMTRLPGGAYVDDMKRAVTQIKKYLKKQGVRAPHISETDHGRPVGHLLNAPVAVADGSSILLGLDRYIVVPPECIGMDFSFQAGRNTSGMSPSIGCTDATNRALMASSPRDLMQGRNLDLPAAGYASETLAEFGEGE